MSMTNRTSSVVGTDSAEPSARTCVFQTEPSFNCPERIEGSRDPASVATHSRGVLVLANDAPQGRLDPLSSRWNRKCPNSFPKHG
jgi:hypothetical protein